MNTEILVKYIKQCPFNVSGKDEKIPFFNYIYFLGKTAFMAMEDKRSGYYYLYSFPAENNKLSFCIEPDVLLSFIGQSNEEIEFCWDSTIKQKNICISIGKRNLSIESSSVREKDETISHWLKEFEKVIDPVIGTLQPYNFKDLAKFCATDELRPAMEHICLKWEGKFEDTLNCIVTDAHRLAIVTLTGQFKQNVLIDKISAGFITNRNVSCLLGEKANVCWHDVKNKQKLYVFNIRQPQIYVNWKPVIPEAEINTRKVIFNDPGLLLNLVHTCTPINNPHKMIFEIESEQCHITATDYNNCNYEATLDCIGAPALLNDEKSVSIAFNGNLLSSLLEFIINENGAKQITICMNNDLPNARAIVINNDFIIMPIRMD